MPEDAMSDALILAAIERAERHMVRNESGVLYGNVVDHLGRPRHSGTGRRLRPRLRELEAAGLVESFKQHSCIVYTLTPKGRKQLKTVRPVSLPESPQHRVWRMSREAAGERRREFRAGLRDVMREARVLLGDREASSEAWFELGEHLQDACSRLGSATHCLREWEEPSDDGPDVDRGPWLGRRFILALNREAPPRDETR
jgi:DNA-binding PadR family transcriptional regulator